MKRRVTLLAMLCVLFAGSALADIGGGRGGGGGGGLGPPQFGQGAPQSAQ